jgi:hypothetical protein
MTPLELNAMRSSIFSAFFVLSAAFLSGCSDEPSASDTSSGGDSSTGGSSGGTESSNGGSGGVSSSGSSGGVSSGGGSGGVSSGGGAGRISASGGSGGQSSDGGGSSGGGGAVATPDAGKMPVLPCDKLPAAGMWEDITPHGTSSKPAVNGTVGAAIIVDPMDPRTVWLGTGGENDEIWRSKDCGATWTRVNTGTGSVGDGKTYGGVGDGAQWSMQIDPTLSGVLYATSGYGAQSLWKTIDGGTTWKDVLAGSEYDQVADYRFVNNVSLDPSDHLHVVVSTHGGCKAPYDPSCIAETKDGGATWRVLKGPEGWAEGGGLILVKGGLWIWCGSSMIVTSDSGATWDRNALAGGGSCEAEYTIRAFVPASNGKYYLGSRAGVLRSTDGAKWEHIQGTSGNMVMVTQGSKQVFVSNQWQPKIWSASVDNDAKWNDVPAPSQISQGSDGGIPFLAYDDAHGILYASMFSGGVARMILK